MRDLLYILFMVLCGRRRTTGCGLAKANRPPDSRPCLRIVIRWDAHENMFGIIYVPKVIQRVPFIHGRLALPTKTYVATCFRYSAAAASFGNRTRSFFVVRCGCFFSSYTSIPLPSAPGGGDLVPIVANLAPRATAISILSRRCWSSGPISSTSFGAA
jgi:hypothetical protein